MPFGTLVSGSKSFVPGKPGVYLLSTVQFGMPTEEIRLREPAIGKDKLIRQSLSYVVEVDVTLGGATKRALAMATLNYTFDSLWGASIPAFINNAPEVISNVLTESIANRWALGEI